MTQGADEDKSDVPLPRETTVLFGHDSAEREFLAVYRPGRVPHAWLIGGEPGIGKATLAYRIARFVLARPDPSRASTADTLALDPAHRTVRRVAVNAHPDLLALERTPGDSGKMRTVITVEQVRRLVTFFGNDGAHLAAVAEIGKSTRLNSSHQIISYAPLSLTKKNHQPHHTT